MVSRVQSLPRFSPAARFICRSPRGRFCVRVIVSCLSVLVILIAGSQPTLGRSTPISAASVGCSPMALSRQAERLESSVSSGSAQREAGTSDALAAAAHRVGSSYATIYSGIFFLWADGTSCQLNLQSVNVVFTAYDRGVPALQYVVSETPSGRSVDGVSIDPAISSNPTTLNVSSSTSEWSGWSVNNEGNPSGQWTVPTISDASQCNGNNGCDVDLWVGQTNEYGGSNGISQTGTDQFVYEVVGVGVEYDQYAWYEFYKNSNSAENLCFYVNPGDLIAASSSYSGGVYYTYLDDVTKSESCSASQSSWMGTSYWGNFMEEEQVNSAGNEYWTPPFTQVLFNNLGMSGNGNLLNMYPTEVTDSEYVSVGSLEYAGSGCNSAASCFTLTYDG